jgi:alpha-glucosidase
MTQFRKFPVPANFFYPSLSKFRDQQPGLEMGTDHGSWSIKALEDGVLQISQKLGKPMAPWPDHLGLSLPQEEEQSVEVHGPAAVLRSESWTVEVDYPTGAVKIYFGEAGGTALVEFPPQPMGFASQRRVLLLRLLDSQAPVYGLGEKTGGLDKSRKAYTFWNVDVVADHPDSAHGDQFDPGYVSIPFFATRHGDQWYGGLLLSQGRSWIHTGMVPAGDRRFVTELGLRSQDEPVVALVTEDEPLDWLLLAGPSLRDVVRRLTRLTGTHERPPRWALGYHQCRWSYESLEELQRVVNRLEEARIPTAALWLDIDYMDRWRVFTWDESRFPSAQRRETFENLRQRGYRLVTIVDPGIAKEPDFPVLKAHQEKATLCVTEEGVPYVGTVWPGATVFPDFTQEKARDLWAGQIRDWVLEGAIDGIWNDMNDPSTGPITDEEMRFAGGTLPHASGHNVYADGMARATVAGLLQARPEERPFILTRSGTTGIQRFATVWTGDNFSNKTHLAMSIPQTLNLGLSGVAWNGPDVGGFCDDAGEPLFATWFLAGFLFPFLRNHSCAGTRRQEPYAYGPATETLCRKAINTRLKLLPYLESLFALHASQGDPILRPLSYEFAGEDFEKISDQFMVGPFLMVAPILDPEAKSRKVILPPGSWYNPLDDSWVGGSAVLEVERPSPDGPFMWIRDGALIPTWQGTEFPGDGSGNGLLDLHVFLDQRSTAEGELLEDDGMSLNGPVTWRSFRCSFDAHGQPRLSVLARSLGYEGACATARIVAHLGPEATPVPETLLQLDEWPFWNHPSAIWPVELS